MRLNALAVLTVFALLTLPASAEWKEQVLYSLQGGSDGQLPVGGVVFDKAGNLYGATQDGGSSNCHSIYQCGTVYQLAPPAKKGDPWTETVLYVFKGNASNDGASPFGGLVMDSAGNLYGTTAYGGTGDCVLLGSKLGCGAVYELSPPQQQGGAWTETILYSFPTAKQGYVPNGNLVFDGAGNLYGATTFGGTKGTTCDGFYGGQCGVVFELSPPKKGGAWTEKVLHSFAGGTDGVTPNGSLVLDGKGAVYGTTPMGGNQLCNFGNGKVGCGIAFELIPPLTKAGAWSQRILHRFTDGTDGADPNGGLIFDAKGSLYGSAGGGGMYLDGVVFRLKKKKDGNWTEVVIHTFTDNDHGRGPSGPVTFDLAGNLYGPAGWGKYFAGVVYRLAPRAQGNSWSYSLPYEFEGAPDAAYPEAGLIFDKAGNLYGTTQGGGTGQACQGGCGTVFQVSP